MRQWWRRALVVTVLAIVAFCGGMAVVGYRAGGVAVERAGVQIAQAGAAPDAVVGRGSDDDALDRLLAAVRVEDPVAYKGVTLFPLNLRRDYTDFLPRTFDEAVEDHDLIVEEVAGGEVNAVRVKNSGAREVFIMAGEIMTGSKQDRTAQRDVLVGRRSGWLRIPVYCVEAGRWTVRTPQFGTRRAMANPALRGLASGGAAQESVWEEVDRAARTQSVPQTSAKAFQEIYENKGVKDHLEEYVTGLKLPRDHDLVGFVAFDGERVLGADVFGSPALFAELRDKLTRSYLLAVSRERTVPRHRPTAEDGAHYLARAWSACCQRTSLDSPGLGESYRLRNLRQVTAGAALVYHDEAVHLSLFPETVREPVPILREEGTPVPRPQSQR